MIGDNFEGGTRYDDDHDKGPFKIRAGGTGEFVSLMVPLGERFSPIGKG